MNRIKRTILNLLYAIDRNEHVCILTSDSAKAWTNGFNQGKSMAKMQWGIIPMPFTAEQLRGVAYGTFITPVGFGTRFGECNVPAPGANGYEQRAYYVSKDMLYLTGDLLCQDIKKFDKPWDSDELVPVIVTVLR